jgi:hypothetical protein
MLCVPWTGPRSFDGVVLPDGSFVELNVEADRQGVLTVEPYLLHQNPFPASVQGRQLPANTFGSPAELAHAYAEAPGVVLNFTLRAT